MYVTVEAQSFRQRIEARTAKVGVIGLGYAGTPLALAFAEAGLDVAGIDVDPARVEAINAGRSYLVELSHERIEAAGGRLSATTDASAIGELDALTICVPTPLTKTHAPNLDYITHASESIRRWMRPGLLVVLQSTTYPGTTEELLLPILESDGLRVGADFFLAYAPERIDPGNRHYGVANTPKLVGGITPECRRRVETLYATIIDEVIPVGRPIVAELAKLHENTFRAVNIGLANELLLMCDRLGVSAWEVIEAAGSKPFGFMPHYPGPVSAATAFRSFPISSPGGFASSGTARA